MARPKKLSMLIAARGDRGTPLPPAPRVHPRSASVTSRADNLEKVRSGVPKGPGLYWYRMNGGGVWRYQEVVRQQFDYKRVGVIVKRGTLVVNNGEGPIDVRRMHRHWRKQCKRPETC
jgi:hypothetical protein